MKTYQFENSYSIFRERSTHLRKVQYNIASNPKTKVAVTKMTLFDHPFSNTKNSLRKMCNPEQKDPYAFNFIKRN